MARFYYLGPWIPPDAKREGPPAWSAPEGTVGLVDLRALDGSGLGFFATAEPLASSDYEAFGDGTPLGAMALDPAARSRWATLLGIADTIPPGTLLDALWLTLTVYSDPDGGTLARPIMPTAMGALELHLGGHSLVRTERMPKDPTKVPHWSQVQRVLQSDYRALAAQAERGTTQKHRETHLRYLGDLARKYGVDYDAASALFVPGDMPRAAPKRPETVITESFDTADGDALGPDLSWTEIQGDPDIDTNRAVNKAANFNFARADSDLSSADHYAESNCSRSALGYPGVFTRKDSTGTITCYWAYLIGGGTDKMLQKRIAGVDTKLGGDYATHTNTTDYHLRLEVNGSSLSWYLNAVLQETLTDTSISSGVRCGIGGWGSPANTMRWNDFEAGDLGGASGHPASRRLGMVAGARPVEIGREGARII